MLCWKFATVGLIVYMPFRSFVQTHNLARLCAFGLLIATFSLRPISLVMFITTWATTRENPITRTLELTLPDKRGVGNDDDDDVGNQICWNNARFCE